MSLHRRAAVSKSFRLRFASHRLDGVRTHRFHTREPASQLAFSRTLARICYDDAGAGEAGARSPLG